MYMNDKLAEELQNEIREIHQKMNKVTELTYSNCEQLAVVIKHQKYQNGGLGEAIRDFKDYVEKADRIREEDKKAFVCENAVFSQSLVKQQNIITDLKIKVYSALVIVVGALSIFIYNWVINNGLL